MTATKIKENLRQPRDYESGRSVAVYTDKAGSFQIAPRSRPNLAAWKALPLSPPRLPRERHQGREAKAVVITSPSTQDGGFLISHFRIDDGHPIGLWVPTAVQPRSRHTERPSRGPLRAVFIEKQFTGATMGGGKHRYAHRQHCNRFLSTCSAFLSSLRAGCGQ